MVQYLILRNPGHNRVYYNHSEAMALAELQIACLTFNVSATEVDMVKIKGVDYLSFFTEKHLSKVDLMILSRLSFFFSIYQAEISEEKTCLFPVERIDYEHIDSKISNLLKYPGKTNEIFTKMMINVALLSSEFEKEDDIQLLDPVAGRGTTLYESLIYGFKSYGVEIESKSVHESMVFMSKFLKNERFKHQKSQSQVAGSNKSEAVYLNKLQFAKTKEDFKSGNLMEFGIVEGDTQKTHQYYKKNSFHLIVGDLPYGVAHGNRSKNASSSRNPFELLENSVPSWYQVLKKGGALCLSWNSFVFSRKKFTQLLEQFGLYVLSDEPYLQFEHRVDQAIKRDIIVAVKK